MGWRQLKRILVVDDDPESRDFLVGTLEADGYRVVAVADRAGVAETARSHDFSLALVDLRLVIDDGLDVLQDLATGYPGLPVIAFTARADVTSALRALDIGAIDYLSAPFRIDELRQAVQRVLKTEIGIAYKTDRASASAEPTGHLIGNSAEMARVYKLIARAATVDSTVLITGETGTGKEVVARIIHQSGPRRTQPFVAVDCTTLPETLFESELFGHERGAFTGAQARRRGLLEVAGEGTCLFDEIGDLSLPLQAKLLRVIQDRAMRRVGGNEMVPFGARLIAATNRDLEAMVEHGQFREDLYYRLDVVSLRLPPLRERHGDIPHLVDHFSTAFASRRKRACPTFSAEALDVLRRYGWPGNVRQLEHVIERTLALNNYSVVLPEDLPGEVLRPRPTSARGAAPAATPTEETVSLKNLSERYIRDVLARTGGNKARAAQLLGIDRRTLYRILGRADETAIDRSVDR